jgi:hypothetical protein
MNSAQITKKRKRNETTIEDDLLQFISKTEELKQSTPQLKKSVPLFSSKRLKTAATSSSSREIEIEISSSINTASQYS